MAVGCQFPAINGCPATLGRFPVRWNRIQFKFYLWSRSVDAKRRLLRSKKLYRLKN